MKKCLIVGLLSIACATQAFAQSPPNSGLTLSGTIDAGVENAGGDTRTGLKSSGNNQSQITFSGSEPLSPGLKATFKVSTQFHADDGSTTGFGNNDTYVGLEGSAGKLRLGRSFDPLYSHALTANDRFGVTGYQTLGTALSDNGIRVSNQVLYITPTLYGLTGTVSQGFAEGRDGSGVNNAQGYGLRYLTGPIELTAARARQTGLNTRFINQVGGAYDFGVARVLLTAQEDNNPRYNGNTDKNAYSLGATAPIGPGLLWVSYDIKEFSNRDNGQVAQLGYKYSLSRRTDIYGQVAARNSAFTGKSTRGAGIGVTHSF